MMDIIRIAEHREQNHEPTSTVAASGNRRTVLILHSLAERLNPSTHQMMTSSYDPNDSKPIPTTNHSDHSARHTSSKGFGTKVVGPATTRSSLAERVGCGTRGVTRGSQHA